MNNQLQDKAFFVTTFDTSVVNVTLKKGDAGYGVVIIGPSEDSQKAGVYVTNLKEGTPAAQSGLLKRGQQVPCMIYVD